MPTYIILTKNGKILGRCDATCYNAKGPTCNCICQGANHGRGEAHAIRNVELLARTIAARNENLHHEIRHTRTTFSLCLSPRDTDSSSE